jgi:hypothetical protein
MASLDAETLFRQDESRQRRARNFMWPAPL